MKSERSSKAGSAPLATGIAALALILPAAMQEKATFAQNLPAFAETFAGSNHQTTCNVEDATSSTTAVELLNTSVASQSPQS
jgi:hypothetical protein